MKKHTFLSLCFLSILLPGLYAQDYSGLENIRMEQASDFKSNEPQILEICNYLTASPLNQVNNDLNRLNALRFLLRWMEGTPDYTFSIDEPIVKATQSIKGLLGIYMAAMTKVALESQPASSDPAEISYQAWLVFLSYCEDPAMNVKPKKPLKEMIKAKNEGRLKEMI